MLSPQTLFYRKLKLKLESKIVAENKVLTSCKKSKISNSPTTELCFGQLNMLFCFIYNLCNNIKLGRFIILNLDFYFDYI